MNKFILAILLVFLFCSCKQSETRVSVQSCNEAYGFIDTSARHPKNAVYTKLLTDLTDKGMPGISLLIEDKSGLWYKSSGYASIEDKTPMQSCHIAKIASVTKLFTAAMIYKLAEEGKLNLDDPIAKFIDEKHISKIENAEAVSIRELLSHSSGIYDVVFDPEFVLYTFNNLDKEKSYEKLLSFAYGKKKAFDAKSKRSYNQTLNHVLLAMVANKVLGYDQSQWIRTNIFNPLKMNSTYIRPQEDLPWSQIAKGYFDYRSEGVLQDLTPLYTGDGKGFTGIYSTVNDLRLFTNALYKSKSLLSPASLQSMMLIDNMDTTMGCAGGCRAMQIQVNGNTFRWYGHPGGEVNYAAGAFYSSEADATITFIVNYGVAFTEMGAYTDAYYEFRRKVFEEVCK